MTLMEGMMFFADAFSDRVSAATRGEGFSTRDLLLALTVVLLLAFALFGWVYFRYRKKADQQDEQRLSQMTRANESSEPERIRRRKRRRRRDHRPRNPSLGQTGGLPPPRPDDQLPKH